VITHIVLFKFKEANKQKHLDEAITRLRAMLGKVPSLRALEVGAHIGTPDRAADLALVTRFDDLAGLQAYAVDPLHVAVKQWLGQVLESAQVVDFDDRAT
jgi:hypothetical protein